MSELKDAAVAKLEREIIKSQPFADNDGYSISDPMLTIAEAAELVRRANALYELVSSVAKVHGERHSRGCVCCYCQKINEVLTDCVLRDCEVTP